MGKIFHAKNTSQSPLWAIVGGGSMFPELTSEMRIIFLAQWYDVIISTVTYIEKDTKYDTERGITTTEQKIWTLPHELEMLH